MKKLLIQAFSFFGVSGIGWIIDMLLYTLLTTITTLPVMLINILTSLVAVSFVYITSTKKIFSNNDNKYSVKRKYLFYIIYQILMILFSSYMISCIALLLKEIKYQKLIAKIIFTPVTMLVNFIFMKHLMEKV